MGTTGFHAISSSRTPQSPESYPRIQQPWSLVLAREQARIGEGIVLSGEGEGPGWRWKRVDTPV